MSNKTDLGEQFGSDVARKMCCHDIAKNLAIHSALVKRSEIITNHFWQIVNLNAVHFVIISWWNLFGKYDSDTHWKNTNYLDPDSFRSGLRQAVAMTESERVAFQEQMGKVRNRQAAHVDVENLDFRIPDLDKTLPSANYLFEQMKAKHGTIQRDSSFWSPTVMDVYSSTLANTESVLVAAENVPGIL